MAHYRKIRRSIIATILIGCAPVLAAGSTTIRIDCPSEISEGALKVHAAPKGWSPSMRGRILLTSIDISDGPPSEMAFLKPDSTGGNKKKSFDQWNQLATPRTTHGAWIACNYGGAGAIILGQRLPENVSECRANYTRTREGGTEISFICRSD